MGMGIELLTGSIFSLAISDYLYKYIASVNATESYPPHLNCISKIAGVALAGRPAILLIYLEWFDCNQHQQTELIIKTYLL